MPRPRKDQEGPTAIERMEAAFWDALVEKPYSKITVGEIAQRAHVNKNAFYYHYSGLEELAIQAIDNTLPLEIARLLLLGGQLDSGLLESLTNNPDILKRSNRVRLIAGKHGSRELSSLLKSRILCAWFDIFGIDESCLDRETMMSVKFALGGLLELLGDEELFRDDESLPHVILGSKTMEVAATTIVTSLRRIAKSRASPPWDARGAAHEA